MTHVYFDSDQIDWAPYFRQQQMGQGSMIGGRDDLDQETGQYFKGTKYMRGYGIRETLSSVGKFLLPIASNIMDAAKGEAKSAIGRIGTDIAEGRPITESFQEQGKAGLKSMRTKLQNCMKQKGDGKRKKKSRLKQISLAEISGDQIAEPIFSGPNPQGKGARGSKKRRKDYLDM
jgi:hypothetical protein